MINISNIKTAMLGVNGWIQSLLSGAPVIDADNLASSSGAIFNKDYSNLVTVENIIETYEATDLTDDQVNTLLKEIVEGSASMVLNAVFSEDDFIQNDILFPYENDFTKTLDNDTSFVGYEINTAKRKDILNIINRITLTFNGIDTIKVLLFNSGKKSLIDSVEITTIDDDETNQELTDWILPYVNSVNGGTWYIGYLRSGLIAKAYNRQYELANNINCFNCISMRPIQVMGHDSETLFDVNDVSYTSEYYGMNFDISTFKHYDSIILQNKNKFSKALGLQVAAYVLDMIANSNRSNRIERSTRENAVIQLNGFISENVKTVGILARLNKEINNLKDTFLNKPLIQKHTLK